MENVEDDFVKKSADGALMVTNLIQSLGSSLVYPDAGNFETNRKLWNMYASEWDPEKVQHSRPLLSPALTDPPPFPSPFPQAVGKRDGGASRHRPICCCHR